MRVLVWLQSVFKLMTLNIDSEPKIS